jgi:hypothetical protein
MVVVTALLTVTRGARLDQTDNKVAVAVVVVGFPVVVSATVSVS